MFESLKEKYDKSFITKETLKGWVRANAIRLTIGITAEEYKLITGEDYTA